MTFSARQQPIDPGPDMIPDYCTTCGTELHDGECNELCDDCLTEEETFAEDCDSDIPEGLE